MSNPANDDLLSRVQLTAVSWLEADDYFTPRSTGLKPIPIVSEVKMDVRQAIAASNPTGLICIVGLEDMPNEDKGGGCLRVNEGRILVRVRETIAINRTSSGTGENALRVAQKVAQVLHLQQSAMSTDGTPVRSSAGQFTFLNIEPASPADDNNPEGKGIVAYHVRLRFTGSLLTFTRRGATACDGSP